MPTTTFGLLFKGGLSSPLTEVLLKKKMKLEGREKWRDVEETLHWLISMMVGFLLKWAKSQNKSALHLQVLKNLKGRSFKGKRHNILIEESFRNLSL